MIHIIIAHRSDYYTIKLSTVVHTTTPWCGGTITSNSAGARIVIEGDNNARPGDSGGAAWIPGKGYVGVVTAGGGGTTYANIVDNPYNVFTWE